MYGWHYLGWSWFPGVVMGIGILLLAAVVVAAIFIARRYPTARRNESTSDALLILRERYARGEIDEQEYQRRREQLLR